MDYPCGNDGFVDGCWHSSWWKYLSWFSLFYPWEVARWSTYLRWNAAWTISCCIWARAQGLFGDEVCFTRLPFLTLFIYDRVNSNTLCDLVLPGPKCFSQWEWYFAGLNSNYMRRMSPTWSTNMTSSSRMSSRIPRELGCSFLKILLEVKKTLYPGAGSMKMIYGVVRNVCNVLRRKRDYFLSLCRSHVDTYPNIFVFCPFYN